MERLFDEEVQDNRSRIRLLRTICHFIPIMEAVDNLHNAVIKNNKWLNKVNSDLRYWQHEREILEMDQRVYELLMKKRNEQKSV